MSERVPERGNATRRANRPGSSAGRGRGWGIAGATSLTLGLTLGLIVSLILCLPAVVGVREARADVTTDCEFLEISAKAGDKPAIDPQLAPVEKKLKKPPF